MQDGRHQERVPVVAPLVQAAVCVSHGDIARCVDVSARLCVDEGGLQFVTVVCCCPYRNFFIQKRIGKVEWQKALV